MRFLYCAEAGDEAIELSCDSFAHLKAQRKRGGEIIRLRNLRENIAYFYEIKEIQRSSARLVLREKKELEAQNFWLKIGWAVCESAVIEKTLPFLNELGVGELLLFYADFSQKNVKLDFARFERILASSQTTTKSTSSNMIFLLIKSLNAPKSLKTRTFFKALKPFAPLIISKIDAIIIATTLRLSAK